MAVSKDNILTRGLSGSIGQLLTFRQRAGKTVVSKFRRASIVPPTEKLVFVRLNFAYCIAYAKSAIKDAAVKARYQLAAKDGQTAFNVATSDALNAPSVLDIRTGHYHGSTGDRIVIEAMDDFYVADVMVFIHHPEDGLIEQGNAIRRPGTNDWLYEVTRPNTAITGSKITAIATDLPGNNGSLSLTLP